MATWSESNVFLMRKPRVMSAHSGEALANNQSLPKWMFGLD